MRLANRVAKLPPYLFAEVSKKIAQRRAEGHDVISLGIGDPDLPTPPHIVDAMAQLVHDRFLDALPKKSSPQFYVSDVYRFLYASYLPEKGLPHPPWLIPEDDRVTR